MLSKALASRALFRALQSTSKNIKPINRNCSHGVWSYREPPPNPPKQNVLIAQVIGGVCWFWVLYHCVTEPEHIYGEWPYIQPSTWSDEELGIPPDSVGPLKH